MGKLLSVVSVVVIVGAAYVLWHTPQCDASSQGLRIGYMIVAGC